MKFGFLAITLFVIGLPGLPEPAAAQDVPAGLAARIDEVFARWSKPGSPGAAVVVVRDGEVLFQKGYGYANLDYDIPITPSTLFDIASMSKQFTAFAIAKLVDEGKLSLDDDVRKHIPELPDYAGRVTVRHLVHHTSGVRDWVELLSIGGYRFDDVIAPPDIMNLVSHQRGLNFDPGTEHMYSNTGYNLLAETVARVSRKPFSQFMKDEVFGPLGMHDTHVLVDHQRVMKNRATSYAPNQDVDELQGLHGGKQPANDGTFRMWVDNTSAPGSSSVVTSVVDAAKWMRNWDRPQVGSPRVLQQMVQRGVLNNGRELSYAFGVTLGKARGLNTITHGGGWRGFRTQFLRFPDQRLSIVVLGNCTCFDSGRTAMQVAEAVIGNQMEPAASDSDRGADRANRREPVADVKPLSDGQLAEYAGDYESDELGTSYSVAARDGKLVVQHRKMDDQLLTHVGGERFTTPGIRGELTYEFLRDSQGRVTGYTLRGARFRGVRFQRGGAAI
jgi:CubicO group peptidase (beta-lactamase class C family)